MIRLRNLKELIFSFTMLLILVVAGCAGQGETTGRSPAIETDRLDVGSTIRAANADAAWPRGDWWRSFGDPQLNVLVDTAIASNPNLDAANARLHRAESVADAQTASQLPIVNGSIDIQRKHWPDGIYYGPGSLADANTWNNTASLGLSYHLDLWNADKNKVERSLDIAHATAASERAAQLELEVNVVHTYIEISKDYELLDIARQMLCEQRKILSLAQRQLDGGTGTQLALSQAELSLPEYEQTIDSITGAIAVRKNVLASLTGEAPGKEDTLQRPTLKLAAAVGIPSILPADLLGHRPDVVAARWTVAAQARGIDIAKSAFYQDVNLRASLGGNGSLGPLSAFLKSSDGSWSAGPALSLPIFDGGQLRANLAAQKSAYDVAVDNYNQTVISALKEIADQLTRAHYLDAQFAHSQESLAMSKRDFNLARDAFGRGITGYLNVLIARTQLLEARDRVIQIEADRLTAQAMLAVALGGGSPLTSSTSDRAGTPTTPKLKNG